MKKRVFIGVFFVFLVILIAFIFLRDKIFPTGKVIQFKCKDISITPIKVTNLTPGNFSVILFREGSGEEIGGVKLIFSDERWSQNSSAMISENITSFENISVLVLNVNVPNPSRVMAKAYFKNESGNETFCNNPKYLEF